MAYPNLKAEMARIGLSAVNLAETINVSDRTVYNWLNGVSRPDIKQAMEIQAKCFPACELAYLFAS